MVQAQVLWQYGTRLIRDGKETCMTDIVIYHNPACGTSCNTLALIRNSGAEPRIIEYLKTPPDRDELRSLLARMGATVRDVLR